MNKLEKEARVEIFFCFFDILEKYQLDSVQVYVKENIDFTIIKEEISMLISKDSDPTESLFYIAGCILAVCKSKKIAYLPEDLYNAILSKYKLDIAFAQYCLALDFLFLIDKIENEGGVLYYVH